MTSPLSLLYSDPASSLDTILSDEVMPRTARPGDPPERNLVASVSVLTQTAFSCTILQAHPRNILLHASYASRSSHERLSPGPIGWISTILDMNFREFIF